MNMTAFQREGLQPLGYTKRESEFLFLVATHSGYFTTANIKLFAQTNRDRLSHAFIAAARSKARKLSRVPVRWTCLSRFR